jgi:hypothetical protein
VRFANWGVFSRSHRLVRHGMSELALLKFPRDIRR